MNNEEHDGTIPAVKAKTVEKTETLGEKREVVVMPTRTGRVTVDYFKEEAIPFCSLR